MLDLDLKYYMFDWDDNILHMPTKIHLEAKKQDGSWKNISVSTSEFAKIRSDTENYRAPDGEWANAFSEFHDYGDRGDAAFLEDTKEAIKLIGEGTSPAGPSFDKFKKALTEGRLFAIITARSHSSASIRKGVEYFIEQVLLPAEKQNMFDHLHRYGEYFDGEMRSDEAMLARYLDMNRYRGVTSPEFMEEQGISIQGAEHPEQAKQLAVQEFMDHVGRILGNQAEDFQISVGFSDDDVHNLKAIESYICDTLKENHPEIKFVVYDTSDPKEGPGRKIVLNANASTSE